MDLPSDSDESDVDFVPEGEPSDAESEADADVETEAQYENEKSEKLKRKAQSSGRKSKRRKNGAKTEEEHEESKPVAVPANPEEAKKHEDALWASFLSDSSTPKIESTEKPKVEEEKVVEQKLVDIKPKPATSSPLVGSSSSFLTSKLGGGLSSSPLVSSSSSILASKLGSGLSSSPLVSSSSLKTGGGLSSILGQIGKKSKVSVLEKSKQDWVSFKKDEDIEEELNLHNKGKSGFLDRQDFLQRTDLRQFEIEKNLRTTKRSNR